MYVCMDGWMNGWMYVVIDDVDSRTMIALAAFGSSVAWAAATRARSSGVHRGLPSDQLPRHLSYHWADESNK